MTGKLKVGDRVKIIDGYGSVQSEAVVVKTDETTNIVFVKEWLPNGRKLVYGVPLGAAQPVKTRPSLGDVVHALRTCFGLKDKNER